MGMAWVAVCPLRRTKGSEYARALPPFSLIESWHEPGGLCQAERAKLCVGNSGRTQRDHSSMPQPHSLPLMESTDAKMIRAYEQIETLEREIDAWFSSIDIKMYLQQAPDQLWPWLVVHPNDYIPPIRLSVLAGECVHNMRSALDNLICALAMSQDANCKCTRIAFPISKDEADWKRKAKDDLRGVPVAAQDVVRKSQPWVDVVAPHPLAILSCLSSMDKHRMLNFTVAYNRGADFQVYCNNGDVVQVRVDKPQYFGSVQTFTLPIDKRLLQPSARVKASGTSVLTFRADSDWDDLPVRQVLASCFDYVETKVIARLRSFFEPATPEGT